MPRLKPGEEVIGYFLGYLSVAEMEPWLTQFLRGALPGAFLFLFYILTHSWWMAFFGAFLAGIFQGLLGTAATRECCVTVTTQGIHSASGASAIPYLGKTASYRFYSYDDIANIKLLNGYVSYTLALQLKDGKNILYGISKFPDIDAKAKQYLLSRA